MLAFFFKWNKWEDSLITSAMKFIANENLSERTLGVHRVSAFYHNSKWHAQIIGTNSCHFPHNCRLCFCPQNASTLVYNCNSGYFLTHQLWKPKHVLLCFVMVSPYRSHFRPEHVKQNQPNTSKYHSQNTILQHILGYVPVISPFITKQINMSNFQKLIELSLSRSHLIVIVQCFPCFPHYPGFPSGFPMISIISMFFHVLVYVAFQGFPSNFWWVFPSSASWCSRLFLWIFHDFPMDFPWFSLWFSSCPPPWISFRWPLATSPPPTKWAWTCPRNA